MSERRRKRQRPPSANSTPPEWSGAECSANASQKPVKLLVPGMWVENGLNLVQGDTSSAKSTLLAAAVAAMTGGPKIPGWKGPIHAPVVWCAAEEDWESVIVPRLARAGADLRWIARPQQTDEEGGRFRYQLPDMMKDFRAWIVANKVRGLVLDPGISIMSPGLNALNDQQSRMFLEPLAQMCYECKVTVWLTRHLTKSKNPDLKSRGQFAPCWANLSRSLVQMDQHPTEEQTRLVTVVKIAYGNVLPCQIVHLDYGGQPVPRVRWVGESYLTAELLTLGLGDPAEREELNTAELVCCAMIGKRRIRTADLFRAAGQFSITPKQMYRAKARLRIPHYRIGYGSDGYVEWGPPPGGWPPELVRVIEKEGGEAKGGRERIGSKEIAEENHQGNPSFPSFPSLPLSHPPHPPTPPNGEYTHEETSTRLHRPQETGDDAPSAGVDELDADES